MAIVEQPLGRFRDGVVKPVGLQQVGPGSQGDGFVFRQAIQDRAPVMDIRLGMSIGRFRWKFGTRNKKCRFARSAQNIDYGCEFVSIDFRNN